MAIEITNLTNPDTLTTGLVMLISIIVAGQAFLAFHLYNVLVFASWTLTIIVFVLIVLLGLPFLWFWIAALITTIVIMTIGGKYYVDLQS